MILVHERQRLLKALEIRESLKNAKIDASNLSELKFFCSVLNEWIKYGGNICDKIKINGLDRYLWYQLTNDPKTTVVKLTAA